MNKKERFCQVLKKHNIALAYIFGSQKEKAFEILESKRVPIDDPLTDIDLGVVFNFNLEKIRGKHKLYSALYNELSDIFEPYPLDLVFLEECHSIFQMEAIEGICVYKVSEEFKDNYEMAILRRYPDFKYFYDKFLEEALEEY